MVFTPVASNPPSVIPFPSAIAQPALSRPYSRKVRHLTLVQSQPQPAEAAQNDEVWDVKHLAQAREDERGSGRLQLVKPRSQQFLKDEGAKDRFTARRSRTLGNTQASTQYPPTRVPLRLIAIGTREAVIRHIKTLHYLKYAEATAWSSLQPGPNPGEVMSIVTIRVPAS